MTPTDPDPAPDGVAAAATAVVTQLVRSTPHIEMLGTLEHAVGGEVINGLGHTVSGRPLSNPPPLLVASGNAADCAWLLRDEAGQSLLWDWGQQADDLSGDVPRDVPEAQVPRALSALYAGAPLEWVQAHVAAPGPDVPAGKGTS